MIAIINNNLEHIIPITDFLYDQLINQMYIKNRNISEWNQNIIDFLRSLVNETITSIVIKQDSEIIHDYQNLNGVVTSLNNEIILHELDRVIETVYISIQLNS